MRVRWRGPTLCVAVFLLVLVSRVPARQPPAGHEFSIDPHVTGAVPVTTRPGSGGARVAVTTVSARYVLCRVMPTCIEASAASNRTRAGGAP